jgi:hypothetical protein
MKPDWLKAAADAIRRNDQRNVMAGAVAGLGAALAIGGMEWLSIASHWALAGAVLLTAFAWLWHRGTRRRPWPQRWV